MSIIILRKGVLTARVKVADTFNEIMATDDCLKLNWYRYNDIIHSLTHSLPAAAQIQRDEVMVDDIL